VGTRYKSDDFTPYIYKTEDYGKSWKLITHGIDKMHFARCLRADLKRPGLLYAGTEYGMYISFDDGASWQKFQLNLPMVPVTDLTIKENDLVVATQGRAFYVIDDLSLIQQMNSEILSQRLHVFGVNPAWRMQGGGFRQNFGTPRNAGTNPPNGVVINYYLKDVNDSTKASVTFTDKNHKLIKTFSTDSKDNKLDISKGMNQFMWNMQYQDPEKIESMILWTGGPGTIVAPPGNYFAKFKIEKDSVEVPFTIKADPNYKISQEDYDAQFAFLVEVQNKFNEVQKAIKNIRTVRTQINELTSRWEKDIPKDVKQMADSINKQMTAIEETLYQTKAKSGQDVLNYPIKLNDKLGGIFNIANSGNMAPSKQVKEAYADIAAQSDMALAKLKKVFDRDVPALNDMIRQKTLPVIGVKKD